MISRTLGLEFGGSIGTLFFFANVVGCAMAISGCTEGVIDNFGPGGRFVSDSGAHLPDGKWWRFLVSSGINTSMLLVCLVGAALFAKTSVLILGTVTVCLFATYISFLTVGATNDTVRGDCNQLYRPKAPLDKIRVSHVEKSQQRAQLNALICRMC